MRRILLLWAVLWSLLPAIESYTPIEKISAAGAVEDMVLRGDHLVIGTAAGTMEIYDYLQKRQIAKVILPKIKDFMGDSIPAAVNSVDEMNGRFLILSNSGVGGYSDLRIRENNATRLIYRAEDKKAISKARFIDRDHILLGYLSNDVALLDLKSGKELYSFQISESKFSDFALNEDRSLAAFSCESGEITVLETRMGKILKRLHGINLDNVNKVDIKKDYVVGAGKDRRASWYNWKTGEGGYFKAKFFIYAAALSPDASRAAYAMDEQNDITVYDLLTKSPIALLKGQTSTLNCIVFKDDHTLFSAGEERNVLMWKIK